MHRRTFLAGAGSLPAWARGKAIDLSRISILTDECAVTPQDAIAFAKQYGLRWVELRSVPGVRKEYAFLEESVLRDAAKEIKDAGLGVSFLNTGMLKFSMPGTEPVRRAPETPEQRAARTARDQKRFDSHIADLKKAISAAHIFNVDKVRVFTFSRVEKPTELYPRIAVILNEMGAIAKAEGIELLIENEGSCNVATSGELKALLDLVPAKAVGINWDPINGRSREVPFPTGYDLLPKKRIHNVQMKAHGLVIGPDLLKWNEIFEALQKDGYRGKVGLETHVFDGTLLEKAHLSMKELVRLTSHSG